MYEPANSSKNTKNTQNAAKSRVLRSKNEKRFAHVKKKQYLCTLFMCRGALACAKEDEMTDRKTIKKQTERQSKSNQNKHY